jgi:hypothetical protein
VTVKNNETKQIEFVTSPGVPAEKFYVFDGSQDYGCWGSPQLDPGYGANTGIKQVRTMLQFNTGEKGANAQLPKGVVRMYQNDVDGNPSPIGENAIEHTPKDEDVRLYVGDVFDMVGERVQTDFKKLSDQVIEESYEITLRNHKKEPVQVRVAEHLYRRSDWEIVKESAEHNKLDSGCGVAGEPTRGRRGGGHLHGALQLLDVNTITTVLPPRTEAGGISQIPH